MIQIHDLHKNTTIKCTNCFSKADVLVVFPTGISEERCKKCTGLKNEYKRIQG